MSVLAAKLGRAVYHMLRKQEAFAEKRFWNDSICAGNQASPAAQAGVACS